MLARNFLLSVLFLSSILLLPAHAEGGRKLPVSTGTIEARRPDGKEIKIALWYPKDALQKPCPVLIFSHGYSGGGLGQSALTSDFAAHGWIVAAPDHSDDVMAVKIGGKASGDLMKAIHHLRNEKPFDPVTYSYRPTEMETALEAVLHYDRLKKNPDQIAFAGHSMGGWTAMTASLKDNRVKAVVLYSMGELHWLSGKKYFQEGELAGVRIPSIFFYGQKEARINPRGSYAQRCFESVPESSYLVEIPGANHFVYNDKSIAPNSGGTPGQLVFIARDTEAFLDKHVLGIPAGIRASQSK